MQKHGIALSSILLFAMSMCSATAYVLPLASELAVYRADENVYGSDKHSYSIAQLYASHSSARTNDGIENCILD